MKYTLGLDIGIASVGWAVLNYDQKRIEDLGVRAFAAAESPRKMAPLAEPRRLARGARRRLRRKAERLRRARSLFVMHQLVDEQAIETALADTNGNPSPWQLRAEGLDRLLTGEELARALYHIIKHRGFKSNRKDGKDKEAGKMLEGIAANRATLRDGGYRTAGEMYWRDERFKLRKRNSHESYINTIDRDTLEAEIGILLEAQRALGSKHASMELQEAVTDIFKWQKPFASGDAILKLVGPCTFLGHEGEIRAPKCGYHAERFRLLQDINKLSYSVNGSRPRLTPEQAKLVENAAYSYKKVTYKQLRKLLGLPEEARFTGLEYMRRPAKGEPPEFSLKCEDATAFQVRGYHALQDVCTKAGVWDQVKSDTNLMDEMAFALTFYKTNDDISAHLSRCGAPQAVIDAALTCESFSGVLHISTAAAKRIIPHLEEGLVYSDACAKAGFNHSTPLEHERSLKLPLITRDMVSNPVVHRALCQARRVINAVVRRYGPPYSIHVELARDVGHSAEKRKEIRKQQDENRRERERQEAHFKEAFPGTQPKSSDLLKWRLYKEQNGQCAYSQRAIDLSRLMEPGYVEIDHILPYSRSFDDSRSNKVLVLAAENQNKRNATPYEAFGHQKARWDAFEAWVKANIHDHRKRENLLRQEYNAETEEAWKDRHLNDTRYASRFLAAFLRDHLLFADPENKQPVVCLSGGVTANARWLWGLTKCREENDLHHAMDAAVVAALLPHQVRLITEYAKVTETGKSYIDLETGEVIEAEQPRLPQPWPNFGEEIVARLSDDPQQAVSGLSLGSYDGLELRPIIVSRMVRRRHMGQIHKEKIRSARRLQTEGVSTLREPLTSLDRNSITCLVCEEADPPLYAAICARMAEFDNDGKKAFETPLRKPAKDGKEGPVVRSVKVWQRQNTGINVRGGIADNGDMVRTDVFRKDGKYYLVPVYVSHVLSGVLPNRAIAAGKAEDLWPGMDEHYEFLFCLHPYDLIRLESGNFAGLCNYRGTHRGDGRLKVSLPNGGTSQADDIIAVGSRNATLIEKYEIDVLGDYRLAPKEKRSGLEDNRDLEAGEAEC